MKDFLKNIHDTAIKINWWIIAAIVTALNLIVIAIIPGQQLGLEGLFASAVAAVLFALFGLFEKFKPL